MSKIQVSIRNKSCKVNPKGNFGNELKNLLAGFQSRLEEEAEL